MCKCCERFFESLEEERTMTKKEFLLIVVAGVLAGIVFGFLFSPRKTMVIGSYNDNNSCCDDDFAE